MSFESLNQLSATIIGGGKATPRRRNAATRPSSMLCIQCSLSRHGAPGPVGSGRRMAKSTGTTSLQSPTTTTSNIPSMPESTRCSCPLHQVPTRPNCAPYFLNTGLLLASNSVSYGKATAYLPVLDLLKGYFQIESRDDARRIREKVTGKLLTLDRALE